ncbi:endonuclease/exonuclease/phosphatase family protein [Caulobacter sp. KR2-114]|uniref:endonuclease/exonuclease/phosphatase family protein n=1 Tax=Caulobacter sp. KR2-114 TaxID=3400912 RepID=UPI003C0E6EC0
MAGLHWLVVALRALAFLLALGAAAFGFLALGGVVSRWLDVLTHFAPLYLIAGLGAVLLRLATGLDGSRPTLTLGLAAVAFAAILIAPELLSAEMLGRLRAPAPPQGRVQTVKLLQFNLWERNLDPEGTARWIAAQGADVVVLEEVNDHAGEIPDLLRAQYPYRTTCWPQRPCSTTILTRVKPTASAGLMPPPARLSAAWVTLGAGADAFTVAGVHYTWPIPPGPQQNQSHRLEAALTGFDRRSLIVAGDMNSTPWSFTLRRQDARFGLQRRTRALFTWPVAPFGAFRLRSPLPFLAIDQVYAGSDWTTVSVKAGPRQGSDHQPVTVVLQRPR